LYKSVNYLKLFLNVFAKNMVGKIFLFIVSVMLFQTTSTKVVLFFGDSLSAGYGLSPEEAFPALVEKSLVKQGLKPKL